MVFDQGKKQHDAVVRRHRALRLTLVAGAVFVVTLGLAWLVDATPASGRQVLEANRASLPARSLAPHESAPAGGSGEVDYRSAISIEDVVETLPAVELGGHHFTVVVHKKRLVWPPEAGHRFDPDDDETAVSFDVRDAEGKVLFKYDVLDNPAELELSRIRKQGRISFSYSVHPYLMEGAAGRALMVNWYFFPSAPSACTTHVVLGLVNDELVPFGEPFCESFEAPRDLSATLWRLKPDEQSGHDVFEVRNRTEYFTVIVPVWVNFSAGKLLPSRRCLRASEPAPRAEFCEFPVQAVPDSSSEESFVRLFPRPDDGATPRHVVVRPESQVDFVSALTPNIFTEAGTWSPDPAQQPPWLKVRIAGKEGWVREPEDLLALGLRPAG
jgi:hypothetical protein